MLKVFAVIGFAVLGILALMGLATLLLLIWGWQDEKHRLAGDYDDEYGE